MSQACRLSWLSNWLAEIGTRWGRPSSSMTRPVPETRRTLNSFGTFFDPGVAERLTLGERVFEGGIAARYEVA